ncbi:bifunctional aconitate hydratase 2/2-methylisocitrate dehydratase [Geoalkalibacter halelectricus]|uniref:Aconitate hydratase B n=1 Tax=Geoalkalibacter halelectricus TaxID=2847045 RepID=A0ABY5ZKL5_9BACT|nr:bifunctional aconitate hydratase 2/2-methylisocitrate dehydratase [Geoalkalibacter halelectricus]MDO3376816.1 bifunctional aconitate hydratase 2/2-methylisocitrate dehydratase [Geoalkalibacter halelectricus]UWZ79118.1 bifunctional aconitate hydratase 2/2-methylisocitrate dehydratase [Geoalkalibacter halelectricus]
MIDAYLKHQAERNAQGIPALPLSPEQTAELCKLLESPPAGKEEFLLDLFKNRVSPGVDPAAEVKADFLAKILQGKASSSLISKTDAVQILGTMIGGYNVKPLVDALKASDLAEEAAKALSGITLVYDAFDEVAALSKNNAAAKKVMESWANAEWFTKKPGVPETIKVKVFKVDGEINTDDFSPAGDAWSRPDIPLHALAMGKTRFPGGLETIAKFREEGHQVAFVGDVVGTGSSRKSACNSVLWHIGREIPCVPNKKTGGVIIGGVIAPIFFNTAEDSGALPLMMDVSQMNTGDLITINTKKGEVTNEKGEVLATFQIKPNTLADEFRAGGRIPLIIGRSLTNKARKALGMDESDVFAKPVNPTPKADQGYTLAQKMVGQACGLPGVLPGTACEPKMTTVGSQDTTGPMTADELKELACLRFQSPMFMQSFCHTAAYPKPADVKMHKTLPQFIAERAGVALRPGDGVIHSWLNRLLVPDTVGTGGDSHTRFPIGISFPAGSGLVAFAGAMGFMPLDMPESVLVRFKGKLNEGITLRDVVNAIPYWAIKQGLLTVPKKNKKNIFNGRILEMEGLPDLSVEQAFELTDAAAERSAAAGCIQLSEDSVATYLRSNVALMEKMIEEGYQDPETLRKRIDAVNEWLKNPKLLKADKSAEYAAVIEIDLAEITEPILACPNDPDDVKLLSDVAGTPIQDVFLGSCMTNIGHFRAAGEIWRGQKFNPSVRTWLCPPTRMDQDKLKEEAYFAIYSAIGARIEIAGCSLCMGNQARVPDEVNMFSTSTRNFDDRIGNGAKVYLGSAELGAVITNTGKIPTPDEYLAVYKEKILPKADQVYQYLQFDEMEGYGK